MNGTKAHSSEYQERITDLVTANQILAQYEILDGFVHVSVWSS
jgi:hypothetical protein